MASLASCARLGKAISPLPSDFPVESLVCYIQLEIKHIKDAFYINQQSM